MVDEVVDDRGGDGLVAKHAGQQRQVAGADERGVFVARADELEEQIDGVFLEGQVVAKNARCPRRAAVFASAGREWALPVPGGPSNTILRASVRNSR